MTKQKMNIGEMLKGIMEAAQTAQAPKTKKVKVGRVSREMVERIRAIDERHDQQHAELSEKLEAYKEELANEFVARMKEFADRVRAEHQPDCRKHSEDMAAAWDDIHAELGLPDSERAADYKLNGITGDVTKEVPIDEPAEPKKESMPFYDYN